MDRDPSVTDEEYQAALHWFYHEIAWEQFIASGGSLQFQMIYWLESVKLGMALGEVSATRAVEVVAYGVSRVEFEHLLSEIIDLHANPDLIDTFQGEEDMAYRNRGSEKVSKFVLGHWHRSSVQPGSGVN